MYNYNKNLNLFKFFNKLIEESEDKKLIYRKLILLNFIYDFFPSTLKIAKNKKELKKGHLKRIKKEPEIFFNNEFIYFNEEVFRFLIIDIDHKKRGINKILEILNEKFIIPNWIIETTKGFQIAFIIDKPFITKEEYQSTSKIIIKNNEVIKKWGDRDIAKYALFVLKKLSILLDGDPNAIRLKGFFRNPIGQANNKKLFFYTSRKYLISELDFYAPDIEKKIKKEKKPNGNPGGNFTSNINNKITIKTVAYNLLQGNLNYLNYITIGKRNSFLWYYGMYLSKIDPDWENRLDFYNNNLNNPLGADEMDSIKKSIKNYNSKNKNFINLGGYNLWTNKLKSLYMKEYRKRKGITEATREEKKEMNKTKILQAIYKYKKENSGKVPSIRKLAKILGMSKNTINKYIKELKKDPKYAPVFNK
jgi:hypothetical protein